MANVLTDVVVNSSVNFDAVVFDAVLGRLIGSDTSFLCMTTSNINVVCMEMFLFLMKLFILTLPL